MFVGQGGWDDEAVSSEMRRHVAQELGEPDGVIVLDPSGFSKKGDDSCGVTRQWCGRLGKVDNCQIGVFLAYVSTKGHAPLDRRLYLPREWADDPTRREAGHVPEGVAYQKTWEIAADLLARSGPDVPHRWVVGDDEFGRASEFRALLRDRGERYVLDVPCNTRVRDLQADPPPRGPGRRARPRMAPWVRVDAWATALPAGRWSRFGGENPGGDGVPGPRDFRPSAPPSAAEVVGDRRGDQQSAAA